jgi:hypothetical protein
VSVRERVSVSERERERVTVRERKLVSECERESGRLRVRVSDWIHCLAHTPSE